MWSEAPERRLWVAPCPKYAVNSLHITEGRHALQDPAASVFLRCALCRDSHWFRPENADLSLRRGFTVPSSVDFTHVKKCQHSLTVPGSVVFSGKNRSCRKCKWVSKCAKCGSQMSKDNLLIHLLDQPRLKRQSLSERCWHCHSQRFSMCRAGLHDLSDPKNVMAHPSSAHAQYKLCAPCAKARHRQPEFAEAKRAQQEKLRKNMTPQEKLRELDARRIREAAGLRRMSPEQRAAVKRKKREDARGRLYLQGIQQGWFGRSPGMESLQAVVAQEKKYKSKYLWDNLARVLTELGDSE